MDGCQGTWAKLFMDTMWYLDASLWGREAFRSPSNTHPSLTLISQRPPFLSICVCDSETACDQLLGGVYACLCEHMCVRDMLFSPQSYDKCSTLSSHHGADVPLGRSHTHTHTHTVWLSQPAKLLAWLLGYGISSHPSVDMAASAVSKAQSCAQLDELFKWRNIRTQTHTHPSNTQDRLNQENVPPSHRNFLSTETGAV